MPTTRILAVAALLIAPALVACGSDTAEPTADTTATSEARTSAGSDEQGTFPAVVEHRYGSTTIEQQPTRVVSVGLTEQDILLELGVTPVAVTEWYGEQPSATWPWAQDLLGDAEPTVLSDDDGIEFEEIAALEPDLIIGTNSGMTEQDYQLLSAIAPTVTSVEGSTLYFSSWQDQTLQVARALGREADGQALVDGVEDAYAAAAAAHPEWAGLSATFSQGGPYDGELYVYPDGLGTDFLSGLGFTLTPGLEAYAPDSGSQAEISGENVGLIDADVIVFATESQENFEQLQGFASVPQLEAVAGGRAVYTDPALAGAIYFLTPLSLRWTLDRLVPLLEKATAGELPTTFPST